MDGNAFLLLLTGLGYLLGHLAFDAGVRSSTPLLLPIPERAFLKLAAGICALGWAGVLLAETGHFGSFELVVAGAFMVGTLGLIRWMAGGGGLSGGSLQVDYSTAVVLLLAGIALYLYAPPFENFFVARDFGTYELSGVNLARRGSMTWHDPLVTAMGAEEQEYFFPDLGPERGHDSPRMMGFYLENRETGRIVPQAMPLYPAWVGVGYLVGGLSGAEATAACFALLAAIGLYFLGRRLVHPVVGIGASTLLAANYVQAWFARAGAAEMAAQALVVIGCYALLMYRRYTEPFFGALAGVALGLTWLTKAELYLLALPLGLLLLLDAARGRLSRVDLASFWLSLGLLGVHAGAHARWGVWPYIADLLRVLGIGAGTALVAIVGTLAGGGLFVAWTRRWPDAWHGRVRQFLAGDRRSGRIARDLAAAACVAGLAYGYWIRPELGSWDLDAVLELAWAVSPAGLALAGLGVFLALRDRDAPRAFGAVAGILLIVSALILWHRFIIPRLFWAYRRFLPVVLPTTALMGAYGGWRLWDAGPGRLAARFSTRDASKGLGEPEEGPVSRGRRLLTVTGRGALAILLLVAGVALVDHQQRHLRRYYDHRNMAGSRAFLERLDGVFEDGSLLVFEPRTKRGLIRFEAAMALLLDHPVVRLPRPDVQERHLRNLVRRVARRGEAAYLVTTGYLDYFRRPGVEHLGDLEFSTPILEDVPGRLPRRVEQTVFAMRIYRFQPTEENVPEGLRLDFDDTDDFYLSAAGWREAEVQEGSGVTFRWTREDAGAWLPGLEPGTTIRLSLGCDAPPALTPQVVSLSLDGEPLGELSLENGWWKFALRVPEGWRPSQGPAPKLRISTEIWSPADHFNPDDPRRLGVKVNWIAWGDANAADSREPRP